MIRYFLERQEWSLERASDGASGYDLRANLGCPRTIEPGERWKISTGLHLEMPRGVEAQVRSRSGLSANHGVIVLNAPGTVDSDYRGEVMVLLWNSDRRPYEVLPGDRIAQLVFAPVYPTTDAHCQLIGSHVLEPERVFDLTQLSSTDRGSGGHGSTGR